MVLDHEKGRMYFDTTGDTSAELAEFYEKFCAEDMDAFRITPDFSKGIYAMEAALQASGGKRPFVKVQTTGPLSFGLSIVDENKRAIYYNDEFVGRRGQGAGHEMPLADSQVQAFRASKSSASLTSRSCRPSVPLRMSA